MNIQNKIEKRETVVWGVKVGAEDWEEEVIYGGGKLLSESQLSNCLTWCKENGFDRVRVKTVDLSIAPDFAKTVSF